MILPDDNLQERALRTLSLLLGACIDKYGDNGRIEISKVEFERAEHITFDDQYDLICITKNSVFNKNNPIFIEEAENDISDE